MKPLTGYQKRSLAFYLAHKDKKLTMLSMWVFNLKLYVFTFIFISAVAVGFYVVAGLGAAIFVSALFIGVLLRDIGTFRKSVMNWPLLNEIIDWKKAQTLSEDGKDSGRKS